MTTSSERPRRVTECLAQAREGRGLSHRQVADATKVSTRMVSALEAGDVRNLPPGIYRRSLVRAVAREVGLEPEATLRAFLQEFPDDLPPPGCAALAEAPAMPVRAFWGRVLALLGALVPVVAGGWYFMAAHGNHRTAGPTPPPVARDADAWRPEIVPAGGFTEAPPPAIRPVSMLITVSARCDLRVVVDGGLVVERAFEAGESVQVAFSELVELSGSNAGVVQYSLNGRAGRMLGGAGEPLSARITRADYTFFLSGR